MAESLPLLQSQADQQSAADIWQVNIISLLCDRWAQAWASMACVDWCAVAWKTCYCGNTFNIKHTDQDTTQQELSWVLSFGFKGSLDPLWHQEISPIPPRLSFAKKKPKQIYLAMVKYTDALGLTSCEGYHRLSTAFHRPPWWRCFRSNNSMNHRTFKLNSPLFRSCLCTWLPNRFTPFWAWY